MHMLLDHHINKGGTASIICSSLSIWKARSKETGFSIFSDSIPEEFMSR